MSTHVHVLIKRTRTKRARINEAKQTFALTTPTRDREWRVLTSLLHCRQVVDNNSLKNTSK